MSVTSQYLRQSSLIVADAAGDGLDLSNLRIVFQITKSSAQTPNSAVIRVYNLSKTTANKIRDEFTSITLNAGYESNFGLIFTGNIKQVKYGRENNTDTYVDIAAGDGDKAYNFSVVSKTLAAGATQRDQIDAAFAPMLQNGVSYGVLKIQDADALPRGKVMFGMSRDYIKQAVESAEATWSIQNTQLQIIPRTAVLSGTIITLTSKTGLIGTPELTNDGVQAQTLLNPLIKVGGVVKIAQEDIADTQLSINEQQNQVNSSPQLAADGQYRVIVAEYIGDTFGSDWYTNITCLAANPTAAKDKEVNAQ
jgi:hypothetical protein